MYEVFQYVILFAVCTYLVLIYSAPSVSYHIKFWSILTWTLNFSMCLLVPEDVYITLKNQNQPQITSSPTQTSKIMFQYLFFYWSVYLLTWTIIPVLQEWENSGDIQSKDRLRRSLRVNGIFYLQMLIGGLVCLFLLFFFNVGGQMGLRTYLKCLATCWGILLQMVMMGYAMVEIPRSLWMYAHPSKYLRYCYKKVREIDEDKEGAIFELKQIASFALHSKLSDPKNQQIVKYSNLTLSIVPEELQHHIPYDDAYMDFITHLNYVDNYQVQLESSIEHHRLMKRILARHRRLSKSLDHFIKEAILYEDVIEAISQGQNQLVSSVVKTNYFNNLWFLKISSFFYKSLAVLVSIFSALILIAETQLFLFSGHKSLLGWLLLFEDLEILRVLIYIVIVFISYMVYYSLFRIKLSNIYGLYKHQSDGPSLMFATINFSRVAFAIVLNFFQMLNLEGIYVDAMGTVQMGLLGQWVIKGIPGVLWLIVLCHYYDLWGKIITQFSLSQDLRFATHQVQDKSNGQQNDKKYENTPFLVRKRRIQLKIQRQSSNKKISLTKNQLHQRLT